MNKQYEDLLILYKKFNEVFNRWETTKIKEVDYYNFDKLVNIWSNLTDILEYNGVIEKQGIKHYRVVKTKEVI